MGDFNARVGEKSNGKVIGKYGLRKRNDRGQMLSDFCKKNRLFVTNTLFQQERRRRYTWTAPPRRKKVETETTPRDQADEEDEADETESEEADEVEREMREIKMGEDTK